MVDFHDDEEGGELLSLGAALGEINEAHREAAREVAQRLVPTSRTPPNALDAERALLGGLLLDPSAMERVADEGLVAEDFYRPQHGRLFAVLVEMHAAGEPIDTVTVVDRLHRQGRLDEVGGASGISQLEALIPTSAHVGAYAKMVREKATLRRLAEAATGIIEAVYRQDKLPDQIVDEAQSALLAFDRAGGAAPIVDRASVVKRVLHKAEHGDPDAIPTGFHALDKIIGGWRNKYYVFGAHSSVGKSALIRSAAVSLGLRGIPCGVFSAEMDAESWIEAELQAVSGVSMRKVAKRRRMTAHDWTALAGAIGVVSEMPVHIDDTPNISLTDLRRRARWMKKNKGIRALFVDYLQLLTVDEGDGQREQMIALSKGLKGLQRELDIPLSVISSLRKPRDEKIIPRPTKHDLKESGSIAYDADVIVLLHRDDYGKPHAFEDNDEPDVSVVTAIVDKNRGGPVGDVQLLFEKHITRYRDLPADEYAP